MKWPYMAYYATVGTVQAEWLIVARIVRLFTNMTQIVNQEVFRISDCAQPTESATNTAVRDSRRYCKAFSDNTVQDRHMVSIKVK